MTVQVERKVIAILAERAGLDAADITPDASPESLGIDSMALVDAIFAIEETFGIEVPFNASAPEEGRFDISSIGAIVRAVEELIAEQAA